MIEPAATDLSTDQLEIDVSNREGIQELRRNSEAVYSECDDLFTELDQVDLDELFSHGEYQYNLLRQNLTNLFREVESASELSVEQSNKLELWYNRLIDLYERLVEVYEELNGPSLTTTPSTPDEVTAELQRETDEVEEYDDEVVTLPTRVSKKMQIRGTEQSQSISIQVAEEASQAIRAHTSRPVAETGPGLPTGAVAYGERQDPVNQAVFSPSLGSIIAARQETSRSPWKQTLDQIQYQSIVGDRFGVRTLARILQDRVAQIENATVDVFERWLNDSRASTFAYLKDQTVDDIFELVHDPEIRMIVRQANIKYESLIRWVEEIEEMQTVVAVDANTTLAELLAIYTLLGLREDEASQSNSQFVSQLR